MANSNSPSQEEWLQHFTSLNSLDPSNIKPVNERVDQIIQEVETKLSSPSDTPSPLMKEMDSDEIMSGIKALKKGKAVASDLISNDIIIATAEIITPFLVALFNKIIKYEITPEDWALGIIIPLFKSGDVSDTNCYRGITINSCLSKLFMLLMNIRLQNFCNQHGIIGQLCYIK